jgi:hypothetical protein
VGKTRRNRIKNEIFVDKAGIQKNFQYKLHTYQDMHQE